MGDDRSRKIYGKKCTGTVPKVRNKNAASTSSSSSRTSDANRNVLSNDLGLDLHHHQRNLRRNFGYFTMNSTISDEARPNEVNLMANGNPPSHSSSSHSRRDSSATVPKCDNVTKYPDKKQIEDKLTQIREYIRVTSSLMATMKNTDDQSGDEDDSEKLAQVLKDLRDSEAKLVAMLDGKHGGEEKKILENDLDTSSEPSTSGCFSNVSQKNDLEQRMEHASREIQMLHEEQNTLLSLKQKAENKLREARHIQEKLMAAAKNQKQNPEQHADKNLLENDPELEELNSELPENLYQQVNVLQQKLNMLHNANEGRNDFMQVLDKRDEQLQSEHVQLQEKLRELQNKKMHIDSMVTQLQTMDEDVEEDDIGAQVRKICTMKEQLSKLRDLYELVKTTEATFESQSGNESESEENAQALPSKTDNVIQNQVRENRIQQQPERNARNQINQQRNQQKQINKNSRDRCSLSSVRNKSSSDSEKLRLQAELQAKKRELEEIMCKHKAGTSNLNHDVGSEGKSEFSNSLFEGVGTSWYPVAPNQHNRAPSSERYSSDECPEEEANEYVELNVPNPPSLLYIPSNYRKRSEEPEPRPSLSQSLDCERFRNLAMRTPDRSSIRSASVAVPRRRERSRSTTKQDVTTQNKTQVQKQLELIRSVCDSMLEQQQNLVQQQPQQFRNNLTPSPLYSEPIRQFGNSMNALNTLNASEPIWFNNNGQQNQYSPADVSNYQSMLATNTLQTQTFMLNTLNQCCQMLWLQQRELAALRNTVSMLQERMDQSAQYCPCPPNHNPNLNLPDPTPSPHYHRPPPPVVNNQKTNQQQQQQQVSAACSMPNLNHGSPNIDYNNAAAAAHLLNNSMHGNHHHQLWNGQALNNQVAPGNRANNYWDNFRSYSRQNLLSNKSFQNTTTSTSERSNNSTIEWPEIASVKLNPTQRDSSEEMTPRRRKSAQQRTSNTVPPDVLNVNQIQKIGSDFSQFLMTGRNENEAEAASFINVVGFNETASNNSNSSEDFEYKETGRNRNEWREEASNEHLPRSKLFEELRENVYKEVASLISANECRPHFLIQLFRDLQFISSDPLRCKTLQSLHSLITSNQQDAAANVQISREETAQNNVEARATSSQTGKNSRCSHFRGNTSNVGVAPEETDREECLREILNFIERHGDDFLTGELLETLKQTFVSKSHIFPDALTVLNQLLHQHEGTKISQIRLELLKSFYEMLGSEKQSASYMEAEVEIETLRFVPEVEVPQMQNDDLAEADQSHLEMELEEQEGAVGGILEASNAQMIAESAEDSVIDFPFNAESEFSELGLDQVPTRLTTNHPRSRSNTPNTDRNATKSNPSEHF